MNVAKLSKRGLALLVMTSSLYAGGGYKLATVKPIDIDSPKDKNIYLGVALSANSIKTYRYGPYTIVGYTVKLGYKINKYLALEARASSGITKKLLKYNYTYGAYLVPQYPYSKKVTIYGLLGYTMTKIKHRTMKLNNYTRKKSFSYGIGVDYKINKNNSYYIEYRHIVNKRVTKPEGIYKIRVHGISVGFAHYF